MYTQEYGMLPYMKIERLHTRGKTAGRNGEAPGGRGSRGGHAYQKLRDALKSGALKPGDRVMEVPVAKQLNVSRTPVREALLQLEREGLLVTRGSERVVANPTKEEFVDLYICRAALERLVAERSARLATPSDIEFMAAALDEAKAAIAAGDHVGVIDANTRFHDRMVESARMPPLRQLMGTIRGPILIARRHLLSDAAVEDAIWEEHSALLDAIRQRDFRRAQELMQLHMNNDIERGSRTF